MSAKRKAENELRRDALMVVRARCRGWCEVCPVLRAAGVTVAEPGDHQGCDGHEPVTRGRGGSISDPANIRWSCRWAHEWVHTHPREATTFGLLRHERIHDERTEGTHDRVELDQPPRTEGVD